METVRATARPALLLMFAIVLVALNLRPSMAAIGPLLSAIRGDIELSFSLASLLTMLPVMAMGVAMFFGIRVSQRLGEQRTVFLSLLIIGVATASRLFLDSAAELILSAVLAGVGIALIQALMPALIKSRFRDNVALCMGLYVTSIMGGAAIAAAFAPLVMIRTGSWRVGLAVWAALAVVALIFWMAQPAQQSLIESKSATRQSFQQFPRLAARHLLRPGHRVLHLRAGLVGAVLCGKRLERTGRRLASGFPDSHGSAVRPGHPGHRQPQP